MWYEIAADLLLRSSIIIILTERYLYDDENNEDEMDEAYITYWRDKNAYKILIGESPLKK
jgi:hypothetical protein